MKIFTQSVYILCRNCERKCAAASEYIFYVEGCVAAPRCISMFLKERGPLLLKDISERLLLKENVQLIFFFVCGCF